MVAIEPRPVVRGASQGYWPAALGTGAAPEADDAAKERTGCSSMAFGATPVCPCLKSKKPTPVSVAVPEIIVK